MSKFVGEYAKDDFESFWDYVIEMQQYAIEITKDVTSRDDMPLWNRMLVLSYCAATWNYDRLFNRVLEEEARQRAWQERATAKIHAANERAALKRKIRSLQKQLARAKEKAKTKKAATINKE